MKKLQISKTLVSPEIILSPDDNIFVIRGNSSPEDVRELYYPVIEWVKIFIDDVLDGAFPAFNNENPLKFQIDLFYFNSSSAKFLYDIIMDLKRLHDSGLPVIVEWHYDEEDSDMKEAGLDISILAEMEFTFIPKTDLE
jgi:hypothetical protein